MHYFLSWYKVANVAQWRAAFEANRPVLTAAEIAVEKILQSDEDPSRIVVMFSFADPTRMVAFLQSPQLGALMQAAGVLQAGGDFLTDLPAA